jgi:PAS domain S-box-containing protein
VPLRLVDSTDPSKRHINAVRTNELLSLAIRVAAIGIFETDLKKKTTRFSPELRDLLQLPQGAEMPYEMAWEFIHEADRPLMRAVVEGAAKTDENGHWSGIYRALRADGSAVWTSMCGQRIYQRTLVGGREATHAIGVVIDITHIKEKDEALHESERRLRSALDAAQMGTFEADIHGAEALIDAQEARLLGLPEGTRIVSREELRKRVPLPDLAVSDEKESRLTQGREAYQHEFRLSMPDGSEKWLSAYADIRSNRVFGVNFDVTKRKHLERRAKELTDQLVCIQEDERQKISQELHDSTAQHLVAVSLLLANLRPSELADQQRQMWDDCETSLQEALKELRSFSYLMHPPALENSSFSSTIRNYVDGFYNRTGIGVDLRLDSRANGLPSEVLRTLLRLVQEGLSNIHRHSGSTCALIHIRQVGGRLHVVIKDNGHSSEGTERAATFTPGRGIAGMAARVEHYKGRLRINSGPRGTTVHAAIPMGTMEPSSREQFVTQWEQTPVTAARAKRSQEEVRDLLSNIECEVRLHKSLAGKIDAGTADGAEPSRAQDK